MSEETVCTAGRAPLGAAQRGIWYAHRLDPGNPLHSGAAYLDIRGSLDTGQLTAAVRQAVQDTEALGLAFAESVPEAPDAGPVQYLDPGASPGIVMPADTTDEESALRWMREDLAAGTDPLRGPLSTQALFRLGEERHLWYFRAHHLLLDGMGLLLFQHRADAVLSALRSGSPVPANPAFPLERLWQEEATYRASERCAADRAYWRQQMDGRPAPPLSLAGPAAVASHSFLRSSGTLPAGPADALGDLAIRHESGRPAVLVAAVAALAHRVTGATDIVLGLAVNARLTTASRRTPSMTTNVVPLRLSVHPGLTVHDLIARAASTLRGALRHQRYPQEELRRDLRALGTRRPLFGPTVNLLRAPLPTFGGLPATLHYLSNGPVDDLKFSCYEADSGPLPVDMDANPERYTADELDAHRTRFLQLLAEFTEDPDRPLARIDVRTPAERRRHPAPSGSVKTAAGKPPPAKATLTDLFERQAARTPDRVAVTADDESLTYAELDRRANRLARLLITRGAGPGRLIALALSRSSALPVAILAVLKTGAAYLPLDPGYPAERLALMADDARPTVLVTDVATAGVLPGDPEEIVLGSPAARDALAALPGTARTNIGRTAPRPDDTAYVIYTSGSTGRPKGVLIPHHNVVRLFGTAHPIIGFGPDDVWTLLHSYAFDFSVWEIWGPLLHGGRLVVVPQDTVRTPGRLLRLLARERVTMLSQTPSALRQLIRADAEHSETGTELSLRRIILGGEALDPAMLRDWYARHPDNGPLVVNMYGITETTVHVTHKTLDRWTAETATGSPIGGPLPDLDLYLLDSALRPCIPGIPGELYVSGAGLARGYLRRPGLTAERFVADPFGSPGGRMYRTGDLARYDADGELEYLGRADGQVQLRGFRVETAEIDAELTRLPEVGAAATVLRGSGDADLRLVSYVVPAVGARADPAGLRARLADRLPPQSVPSVIVPMPELPLTPNGKLDREALPGPLVQGTGRQAHNLVEERLCALFEEVLGCGAVGTDDDFFELGGHSLIATRLVSRIHTVFGTELGVGAVFDAPTPADLALRVAHTAVGRVSDAEGLGAAPAPGTRHGPPGVAGPGEGWPLRGPLSAAQRRMWAMHRFQGPSGTYNLPCAVRLTGDLDRDALHEAVQDLVRRHDILRTRYPETAGEPTQEVLAPGAGALVPLRRSSTTDARLADDLTEAARLPYRIETELPLRVHLFTLPDDAAGQARHALLLVLHHIAGDGWSLGPLLRDLGEAYTARAAGHEPRWSHPAPRHLEHAVRDHAAEPDPEGLEFWRNTLDGAPEQLPLPTDRPRPAVAGTAGGSVPLVIDAELHHAVQEMAYGRHATVFMVLHAALAALLTASGAGTDVVIGTPTSGRSGPELDDAVGFFVNAVPLRVDTGGRPAFSELLSRVRRADIAAYDHQDVPFDRVVDAVAPQRSLGRHPLFQVVLSFQDFEPRLALPGLETRTEPVRLGAAKFDLTLNLVERRGEDGEPAGITGDIEYAEDLFDEATARMLADRLQLVIRGVCADPDRPVADIDLLSEQERRASLTTWNPEPEPVEHPDLPALFAARAAARPHAPALQADGRTLDYAELDAHTSRLARLLLARGVRRGTILPLVLPRSAAMATAWLAALKAGAAAMPVDPDYPVERIRRLLEAAETDTPLLTLAAHTASLPSAAYRRLLLDAPDVAAELDGLPATPVTDAERGGPIDRGDPAYVIHTSGSTGRPKGVVVPHAGLTALAAAQQERFALDTDSRVLQFASPSFDASVMEYLMAYGAGATLVVPPAGPLAGEELAQVLAAERISHTLIPPTALTGVPPRSLPGLRTLVVGGEACPPALAAQWSTGRRLVNAYGPTETTACATTSAPLRGETQVPIGTPVAGLRVHVLDDALRLVPPGVPGELYIAGPGVGHGYLGRSRATAERFVADPYGPPGSRAFRTGDMARRRNDGTLEYLGRVDDQVKIRGFRIEPGEISAALAAHPGVRRCAVVVREDRPGDRRLVAYIVPADPADEPEPAELRRHAAALLPAHMVPAAYVALTELPVTTQGKLNREALPEPGPLAVAVSTGQVPRSATEEIICAALADVVGLAAAGPDDDFFALGGDSITAIQLVSRLRGHDLSVTTRDVFECRTAAALAGRAVAAGARTEAVRPAADNGPYPAPPMAHWLSALGPSADTFSQTMTVRTPPIARPDDLRAALQHVLDGHAALRTTLLRGDPEAPATERLRLNTAPRGAPDAADVLRRVPVADADGAVPARVLDAELARARGELAPEQGRMVRAVWFDAGDRDGRLALVIHHLTIDAVSWGVLLSDLRAAYEAAAAGAPVPAPRATHPYAAWAAGLADEATQPERIRELPLWTAMLAEHHVAFGSRRPDPDRDVHGSLSHVTCAIPVPLSRALLTEVPLAFHCRVLEPLLTAFGLALAHWGGEYGDGAGDVLLDLERHGRDGTAPELGLESAVGWFTTVHPLRLPLGGTDTAEALAGGSSLSSAIKQVKEALLEIPGNGRGYGLLRYLNDRTAPVLADHGIPPVAFNYLGRFRWDDSPWNAIPDDRDLAGAGADPRMPVGHALEVNAMVLDGGDGPQLRAVWSWPRGLADRAAVEALTGLWTRALTALDEHVRHTDAGGWAPSDLPLVDLGQSEIEALEAAWRDR